ncbi:hypothetical protein [Streptomyces sp. NBC_00996]|uniref:hypothetical protein n=1 Tax=Streptomyces sp. NBC_00996 TaxID=2903710 RepID=UPI00386D6DE6
MSPATGLTACWGRGLSPVAELADLWGVAADRAGRYAKGGVALAAHGAVEFGLAVGVEVTGHLAGGQAEAGQEGRRQVGDVLAYARALRPFDVGRCT